MTARHVRLQGGTSLVEVLVTMVILSIGLLALVVLHGRLHLLQMESYQRSQALILLNDMATRIALNRNDVGNYLTGGTPLGVGQPCPVGTATRQEADLAEWCAALQGAGELLGANLVGAMVGGRGCIDDIGGGRYLVSVAWQGQAPISAPPAGLTCGANLYDGAVGTPCQGDMCRRVVSTVVR
ncbi:MAG: prepilin-type N-terminal cleavage/methylation domain-containing protein, partial [Steroidobacteraceae bacterium]